MATDFLFVGELFTFVLGIITMFLGLDLLDNLDEFVKAIIYHFLATICFFSLAQFFLMSYTASTAYVLSFQLLFYALAGINFVVFLLWSVQVFRIIQNKRMGVNPESEV